MSYQNIPGGFGVQVMQQIAAPAVPTGSSSTTLDATNEACIMYGYIVTSDGSSHTIDTTGSSSLQWRSGGVTFANAGTTVRIGLAAIDTAVGPPARASNTTNVINFDVYRDDVGGGGGITANAWQTDAPTNGTKTVANGDLICFAIQMTARGGADSVVVGVGSQPPNGTHYPFVTNFTGGSYAAAVVLPNAIIAFSDGAYGWFFLSDVFSTLSARTYNVDTATTDEYGQLYQFPFPVRISGIVTHLDPDANCELILYSDPLGSPVAQRTITIDANTPAAASGRKLFASFSTVYDLAANTPIVVSMRPTTTTNCSIYYKTFGHADHRITEPYGTSGYGVGRIGNSGAFAQQNSGLDNYTIGIMIKGFADDVVADTDRAAALVNGALVQ